MAFCQTSDIIAMPTGPNTTASGHTEFASESEPSGGPDNAGKCVATGSGRRSANRNGTARMATTTETHHTSVAATRRDLIASPRSVR